MEGRKLRLTSYVKDQAINNTVRPKFYRLSWSSDNLLQINATTADKSKREITLHILNAMYFEFYTVLL